MREIYLDNAATTRTLPAACETAAKVMLQDFGNPSSLHHKGFEAEQYIRDTRKAIAASIKCAEDEIVFTSGGTESNNMALFGAAEARKRNGKHIITTRIEHASVYQPILRLEELGYEVTFLPVDSYGHVSAENLANALRDDTIVVSVMAVNNEIGAIEPIAELSSLVHSRNPKAIFHTDAIQAYGKIPMFPSRMGVDLMSVSGHKLHAPKGSGFLYVKKGLAIRPLIYGGGQEKDRRSGTENVPAIAGLGEAVRYWFADAAEYRARMYRSKELFLKGVSTIPGAVVNGVPDDLRATAPHIASVSFAGVRAEVLLHALAEKGIYTSSGSACSSNHPAISGTLKAIGVADNLLDSTLRFSFDENTSEEEIADTVSALAELVPVLGKFHRS